MPAERRAESAGRAIPHAFGNLSQRAVAPEQILRERHAPTLSFPVPGTLMVEPTESETLAEIDRFIHAMIAIREEIRKVERGEWPQDNNPLKNAPHTAAATMVDNWSRPCSRETGAFPLANLKHTKYWTPIGRIDNVYGDRNLFCSCVPVEEYGG